MGERSGDGRAGDGEAPTGSGEAPTGKGESSPDCGEASPDSGEGSAGGGHARPSDGPAADAVDWSVYLVTQQNRSAGRSTPDVVRAALAGGVGVVQLREKHRSVRERLAVGREVRDLTAAADVPLVVNDRADLAQALDADGVHLGDDDLPIPAARELLGADAVVGRSVSFVDDAVAAERAGADYLGVGAVYATGSKDDIPDDEYAVGPERVGAIADAVSIPVVGIGGIDPGNAAAVSEAGADGVAVVTAITEADDPTAAARALRDAVARGRDAV